MSVCNEPTLPCFIQYPDLPHSPSLNRRMVSRPRGLVMGHRGALEKALLASLHVSVSVCDCKVLKTHHFSNISIWWTCQLPSSSPQPHCKVHSQQIHFSPSKYLYHVTCNILGLWFNTNNFPCFISLCANVKMEADGMFPCWLHKITAKSRDRNFPPYKIFQKFFLTFFLVVVVGRCRAFAWHRLGP